MEYTIVAPCHFGSESVLKYEIRKAGGSNIKASDGRVKYTGDEKVIVRSNIHLRSAERVMILLDRFDAKTFDRLFDSVYKTDWKSILPKDCRFPVKGSSISSVLSSVPACQSIVKKAIVEKLRSQYKTNILPETGDMYKIRFSIRNDEVSLMLDTSGDGLHKRGWRRTAGIAPIKETLAATIIDLARAGESSIVEDPFCGSGTLLIESAQRAANIAPGLKRHFISEKYSFIPKNLWEEERNIARNQIKKNIAFHAYGFDIDPMVLEIARKNAEKRGVAKYIEFSAADVKKFTPHKESIVITNPPYGERMGNEKQAIALEKILMNRVFHSDIAGAYVITSDSEFEKNTGCKATRRRKLYNGMIPCQLYMYFERN
jgi:putative N6-adenine-specific DNA methylase